MMRTYYAEELKTVLACIAGATCSEALEMAHKSVPAVLEKLDAACRKALGIEDADIDRKQCQYRSSGYCLDKGETPQMRAERELIKAFNLLDEVPGIDERVQYLDCIDAITSCAADIYNAKAGNILPYSLLMQENEVDEIEKR